MKPGKRLLALMLVLTMVFALAACGSNATTSDSTQGSAESVTASEDTYTYSYSDACPSTWSPTDWQNANEGDVIVLTFTPLWEFMMNDAKDGYEIVPSAAVGMPVDVTADFAGNETYGVPADATEGYAWTVELNPDLCWEDGTPITADDYVYSLQQFLNPEMSNYRASYFYAGSAAFANGQAYYNSNRAGEIGYVTTLGELGYSTVEEAQADGYTDFGVDLDGFWGIAEAGIVSIEDETEYRDTAVEDETDPEANVSGKYVYDTYLAPGTDYEAYTPDYVYVGSVLEGATWDEVGIIKNDDYSLTFIMLYPNSEFNFIYNMSAFYLLREDLYEANKQQTGDIVKSSYGTAVDKYMSYGPYKITTFQEDKEMTLTKNENWFGYTSDIYEGKYQTTDIVIQYITEHSTELSLFLQGNLSTVTLSTDDMETYGSSDYVYYVPESYAYHYSYNIDIDSLKAEETPGENRSILSYQDFREAITWAIDRNDYVASLTGASEVGFGLLTDVYVCDPDTGELYRDCEYAKQAMCDVYGASDESEITGYDKEKAAELFQSAYEQCLADGNISETDQVSLDFHTYSSDTLYIKMVNFLQESIDAATVGTDLEGRVTINQVEDPDYYDNMKNGLVDITVASWGGAEMDPYSMMECYCSDTLLNEYGFDPYTEEATITVNGEEMTMTLNEWYAALCQGEYVNAPVDTKNQILAGMERALLETYFVTPIYYRTGAELYEQRIVMESEEYVNVLVEFGGLMGMTYTMNDAEWAEYCAENNNQLTY